MRLSISVNLFCGEELLTAMLKNIRPEADHISIVYQTVSYVGDPCSPDLIDLLLSLERSGLIDTLYKYNFHKEDLLPQEHEVKKRNIGLQLARETCATHYMSVDVDEFYILKELQYAKEIIEQEQYDATACRMFAYSQKPIYRHENLVTMYDCDLYVPLIYKVSIENSFVFNADFFCLVDPTRRMGYNRPYCFRPDEIVMHHMTHVRKSKETLCKKFANATSKIPDMPPPEKMANSIWNTNPLRDSHEQLQIVPDIFNIGDLNAD